MPTCSIVCGPCPVCSAAAGASFLPMGQEPRPARDYFIQGQPEAQPGERPGVELYPITPDYFKTLEIPVRAGRDFDRSDTPERPRVAIINEALARTAFPGVSPIGQVHPDEQEQRHAVDGDCRGRGRHAVAGPELARLR